MKFFVRSKEDCPTLVKFREKMAWAYVSNSFLESEVSEVRKLKRSRFQRHNLVSALM